MTKVMLSFGVSGEPKGDDGQVESRCVAYVFALERLLTDAGYDVFHCQQPGIKESLDTTASKLFAEFDAHKAYDLFMKDVYEAIDQFRHGEELVMVFLGKTSTDDATRFLVSEGMRRELTDYAQKDNSIHTIACVPVGHESSMDDFVSSSDQSILYTGQIDDAMDVIVRAIDKYSR